MSLFAHDYVDFSDCCFASLFDDEQMIWSVLRPKYKEQWIAENIHANANLIATDAGLVTRYQMIEIEDGCFEVYPGAFIKGAGIEIGKNCVIEPGAFVAGPTILGEGTEVRHGAYIRGGVLTGKSCVIGHATEVKSAVFMNNAKAGHFAYVGDSVLGNDVNLGAGTKISNLKITETEIKVQVDGQNMSTGLRKFGAIIGDGVQTGCNAVLNPGSILGKKCMVYPNANVRAQVYSAGKIIR